MLQSRKKPKNIDVMLLVSLFKDSICAVADAVIVALAKACVLLLAYG